MAWARPRQAPTSLRWSCKRCYTVNAIARAVLLGLRPRAAGGIVAAAGTPALATRPGSGSCPSDRRSSRSRPRSWAAAASADGDTGRRAGSGPVRPAPPFRAV